MNNKLLIAGAGGHSLELLDVIKERTGTELFFFDDFNINFDSFRGFKVLHSVEEVNATLSNSFEFVLAVGQPRLRKLLYNKLSAIGGTLKGVESTTSNISSASTIINADVMKNCFIGPDVEIKMGSLINTGAQIHHQVTINEFCEISPRAVLLGNAAIGSSSSIGANATILPGVKVGNNVIVAAGAVVTKNILDNCMAAGVPAVIKKQL